MSWPSKRACTEILKSKPVVNSNLKKKLSLINRLRMLHLDDFQDLYECLKKENLNKFYKEIINSLLGNNKIQKHEDVHKIIQIIYLYSYDSDFIILLQNELKTRGCESWVNFAIWAETSYLVNNSIMEVAKMVNNLNKEDVFEGVYYLARYFDDLDRNWLREVVKNVEKGIIEKKGELVYQELGLNWKKEGNVKYVNIIKPYENEFNWYQLNIKSTDKIECTNLDNSVNNTITSNEIISTFNKPISSVEIVKMIEENKENIDFLKILSKTIDGQSELVDSVLKDRKNSSVIPGLARVVAQFKHGQRELISRLLKYEVDQITENELVFIGELYKFGIIKVLAIVEILNKCLASRDICKLCILFENVGRFMLHSYNGNTYGRQFVETLKNIEATGSDKMAVETCLGKLFKPNRSTISLRDFLHWFFKEKNFVDGKLFKNLKKSKKFMLLCFMQPELFENEKLLAEIVKKTGLENEIIELYMNTMPQIMSISKNNLYHVANALGYFLENRTDCDIIVDKVLNNVQLPTLVKHKVALELLDHCPSEIQVKYLRSIYEATMRIEIKSKIFNLCEKYGHKFLIENIEEDSFEIDMMSMCSD